MSTVPITYVGHADAVEVAGLGLVHKGETVQCPADLANGTGPSGKPYLDKEGNETSDEQFKLALNPEYHPGTLGLLDHTEPVLWKRGKATKGGDES